MDKKTLTAHEYSTHEIIPVDKKGHYIKSLPVNFRALKTYGRKAELLFHISKNRFPFTYEDSIVYAYHIYELKSGKITDIVKNPRYNKKEQQLSRSERKERNQALGIMGLLLLFISLIVYLHWYKG